MVGEDVEAKEEVVEGGVEVEVVMVVGVMVEGAQIMVVRASKHSRELRKIQLMVRVLTVGSKGITQRSVPHLLPVELATTVGVRGTMPGTATTSLRMGATNSKRAVLIQ